MRLPHLDLGCKRMHLPALTPSHAIKLTHSRADHVVRRAPFSTPGCFLLRIGSDVSCDGPVACGPRTFHPRHMYACFRADPAFLGAINYTSHVGGGYVWVATLFSLMPAKKSDAHHAHIRTRVP